MHKKKDGQKAHLISKDLYLYITHYLKAYPEWVGGGNYAQVIDFSAFRDTYIGLKPLTREDRFMEIMTEFIESPALEKTHNFGQAPLHLIKIAFLIGSKSIINLDK